MVRNKDELVNKIKEFIGENDSDDALALLEDVSDTFADFENKMSDTTDWKSKYEENDKAWRTKYKERFSAPIKSEDGSDDGSDFHDTDDEPEKPKTFDELFKTE